MNAIDQPNPLGPTSQTTPEGRGRVQASRRPVLVAGRQPPPKAAGYLQTRKRQVGKYPRTSTRLTRAGRRAFAEHVAALQQLLRLPAEPENVSGRASRSP